MPGAVLSGSIDGGLRAYNTANGDIIWTFDTTGQLRWANERWVELTGLSEAEALRPGSGLAGGPQNTLPGGTE